MTLTLPTDVIAICTALQNAGYSAYIVGGAVRDLLVDKLPTDWDFTTNATPEQILSLLPEAFYENEFGMVAIARSHVREQFNLETMEIEERRTENGEERNEDQETRKKVIELETATKIHESLVNQKANIKDQDDRQQFNNVAIHDKSVFEITTFRSEGAYSDFRRPDSVQWGKTIEEDLQRRDFTINAMAIQIKDPKLEIKNSLTTHNSPARSCYPDHIGIAGGSLTTECIFVDPHHGQDDLKAGVIRTVGDPEQRFREDALRMLRAIRFSVQLNMAIDDHTYDAISHQAPLIQHVSWERIRDEFLKILGSAFPAEGIELLDAAGLLSFILPELLEAKDVRQGGHHTTDVWTHSVDAVRYCPSSDPIVRLATLLHDIAKPQTYREMHGTITFYNHEIIGARIAKKIALRFKLSRHDCDRIFTLVRHHMFYYQPENTDASIRRFMRKVGLENINDILDLRIGDRLGSGSRETSWRLEEMKVRMQEQLHQPFAVTDLAIDGNDLMSELHLTPGPQIGKILHTLFEEVMEHPELNEKEILLEKAKELTVEN